ncbi:MAG: hypothetical protein LBB40_01805, partial [Holophagales bacterium]|nr:hypothetical protein [Holophagales bacterium]
MYIPPSSNQAISSDASGFHRVQSKPASVKARLFLSISGTFFLCAISLTAQSYQTKFGEIKFDQSKGPFTKHGGIEVEVATGAIKLEIPFGPGIGREGFRFTPALRGHFHPQAPVKLVPQVNLYYNPGMPDCPGENIISWSELPFGLNPWSVTYGRDYAEMMSSVNAVTYAPGYFFLPPPPLVKDRVPEYIMDSDCPTYYSSAHAAWREIDSVSKSVRAERPSHYLGPNGESASVLVTNPTLVNQSANYFSGLLQAFGFDSTWKAAPFYSELGILQSGTNNPYLATDGSLVFPLYKEEEAPLQKVHSGWTDKFYHFSVPEDSIKPSEYYIPERVLVIKGDIAFEYRYSFNQYSRTGYIGNATIYSSIGSFYNIDAMHSRSQGQEKIIFRQQALSDNLMAQWIINGVTQASYKWDGNYLDGQGSGANYPAYHIGVSAPKSTAKYDKYIGTWEFGVALRHSEVPGNGGYIKTDGLLGGMSYLIDGITENWTNGEAVEFEIGDIGSTSWNGLSSPLKGLKSVTYKNSKHKISFEYDCYEYFRNDPNYFGTSPLHYPAYGPSSGLLTMLPVYAFGVKKLTEQDTSIGTQSDRTTTYSRKLPSPDLQVGRMSHWKNDSTEFEATVTHPDNSKTLHKFAQPLPNWGYLQVTSTEDVIMQIAAYIKALEVSRTTYGADGVTKIQDQASDRFSTLAAHNPKTASAPNGNAGLNPIPYPTRTITNNLLDNQTSTTEIYDWENDTVGPATGRGWKTTRQTISSGSATIPTTPNWVLTGQPEPDSTATDKIIIKDQQTFSPNRPDHWLFDFKNTTSQYRRIGATAETSPTTTRTWDTNIQWLKRLSKATESKGALSRTTTFTYKGTTGIAASRIASATLTGTGYTGTEGISDYGYDTAGRLNSIRPYGVTYTYAQTQDALGRVTSQTDPNGLTTAYQWDQAGRLIKITPPNEAPTQIAIDADNRGYRVTTGNIEKKYRYNAFGELIKETQGQGHRFYAYDRAGRLTSQSDWGSSASSGANTEDHWAKGSLNHLTDRAKTSITYDHAGRPTTETDLNGIKKTTSHSARQHTVTIGSESNTASTAHTKDLLGRLIQIKDPLNQTIEYKYDHFDKLTESKQTGESGIQTRNWAYNSFGDLALIDQPESGVTYYTNFHITGAPQFTAYGLSPNWRPANYDTNQSATASSQTGVKTITSAFTTLGRLSSLTSNDGITQAFTYDETGRGASNTKLTTAKSSTNNTSEVQRKLTYSQTTGRLTKLERIIDNQTYTQTMTYDQMGNLSGRTYPDNKVQTITYETAMPLPLTSSFSGTNLTAAFTNNAAAWNLISATVIGTTATYNYRPDQVGVSSLKHSIPSSTNLMTWNYTYDELDLMKTDGENHYTYDKLGRLTETYTSDPYTTNGIRQTLTYDAFGNRVSAATTAISNWNSGPRPSNPAAANLRLDLEKNIANLTFSPASPALKKNQIPAQTTGGAYTGALYNQQGSLTQIYTQAGNTDEPLNMTYDALGRVTAISYGPSSNRKTENYLYDDEGLRIRIFDGATYKYNIYNERRQLTAQYEKPNNGALTWKRDIVYTGAKEIGEVSASGASATASVTLTDHLGTPRHIWDGATLTKQKFMPFGELIPNPNSAIKPAKGFTNHEQTDPSNLIY